MMRLVYVAFLLMSVHSFAADSPYSPELDERFKKMESRKMARVVIDQAAGFGSSTTDSGVYSTGVYLPANALVLQDWMYVVTAFTDAGNNGNASKVALHCEDAGNLKAAFSPQLGGGAGTIHDGASSGASTVFVGNISAPCEIKATVTQDDFSAGKAIFFVDYVVVE
jgi:hypothetical protein